MKKYLILAALTVALGAPVVAHAQGNNMAPAAAHEREMHGKKHHKWKKHERHEMKKREERKERRKEERKEHRKWKKHERREHMKREHYKPAGNQ